MSTKPEPFYPRQTKHPGAINFTMSACEIEGEKTIHLDAFHSKHLPYGHITLEAAKTMRDWMNDVLEWMEQKNPQGMKRREG